MSVDSPIGVAKRGGEDKCASTNARTKTGPSANCTALNACISSALIMRFVVSDRSNLSRYTSMSPSFPPLHALTKLTSALPRHIGGRVVGRGTPLLLLVIPVPAIVSSVVVGAASMLAMDGGDSGVSRSSSWGAATRTLEACQWPRVAPPSPRPQLCRGSLRIWRSSRPSSRAAPWWPGARSRGPRCRSGPIAS